jgi:serine/threonine-protein kinase
MSRIRPVLPFLAESAATLGHINHFPDADGTVRKLSHVVCYQKETCVPSLALAVAALYQGIDHGDITAAPMGIRWTGPSGSVRVPVTEPGAGTMIRWNQGPDVAFHQTPFAKVLKNEVETSLFRDKVVIIGGVASGPGTGIHTPVGENMSQMEVLANGVANLLDQTFMTRPQWASLAEFGVLIFFGLVLVLAIPGMRTGTAALACLILVVGYGAAATALFIYGNMWLKIAPPSLLLAVGLGFLLAKRLVWGTGTRQKGDSESHEANKVIGLSFQKEGMLDLAFQKFRTLPAEEDEVKALLYDLGIAFEKKRQFHKALEAYEIVTQDGQNYRDLDERIPKLLRAAAAPGTGGATHAGDVTLRVGEFQRTIGRYEVIDELGRGAMGVVFKGEDPKIHRTVAIKTINMGQFDEESTGKMKDRFFREAESAGLLAHQNIVTIYDCGEEGDLAYIAMEFLEGEDLEAYTEPNHLLPLRETLRIGADVADALGYAHGKNIVHRDIKPANIMRLKRNHAVKVTDFGIARITSSSQTKTGVVLGTPSYMSPEQVSGKKVDGRSDIFSLGVVLFELLTGQKPFVGDDITTLMFKIAREPHVSPRQINPRIPPVVEKIVDKALEKDLNRRYPKAEIMGNHLRQVIARIDAIQAKRKKAT